MPGNVGNLGTLRADLELNDANFTANIKRATATLDSNVAQMKTSMESIKMAAASVSVAFAAIISSQVVEKAKEFVAAYAAAESSTVKLQAALSATGRMSAQAMNQITDSAEKTGLATATASKDIIAATATFSQFGKGLNSSDLSNGQKLIVGFSKVMGVDLQTAAIMAGKAVAGFTDKLGKGGISIKGVSGEHERLNALLEKTASYYMQATGSAQSLQGQEEVLKIAHEHLNETLGELIVKSTGTHNVIQLMTQGFLGLDGWLKKNSETILQWTKGILQMAESAGQAAGIVYHEIGIMVNGIGLVITSVTEIALKGVQILVDNALARINTLIQGLNKIPGVHVDFIYDTQIANAVGTAKNLKDQFGADFKNQYAAARKGLQDATSGRSMFSGFGTGKGAFSFDTGAASNNASASNGHQKTDPDVAKAKSAIEAARTPLEKYNFALQEANRWLHKNLVTQAQWQEIIDKAYIDTSKMIKINPDINDLTRSQQRQVDPSRIKDFGFGTSPDIKTAMENFITKPFDQSVTSMKEKWDSDIKQMVDAASLIDSISTPFSKFTKEVADYDRQLAKHNITQEQYNQLVEDAKNKAIAPLYPEIMTYQKAAENLKQALEANIITQEQYNEMLKRAKAEALDPLLTPMEAYTQALKKLQAVAAGTGQVTETMKRNLQALNDSVLKGNATFQTLQQFASQSLSTIEDSFMSMVIGGKASFKDMIKSIMEDLAKLFIQLEIINPIMKSLFGPQAIGQQGQGSGIVGNFLSTGLGLAMHLIGFAGGGRPPVGVPSVVGENGKELFIPDQAGTIIPNHMLNGGGGQQVMVVNQNYFSLGVQAQVRQQVAAMMPAINKQTTESVKTAFGRGGSMSKAAGLKT